MPRNGPTSLTSRLSRLEPDLPLHRTDGYGVTQFGHQTRHRGARLAGWQGPGPLSRRQGGEKIFHSLPVLVDAPHRRPQLLDERAASFVNPHASYKGQGEGTCQTR